MVVAIYPGTFDPLTRGHEDLVRRAAGIFDKLVVGVADSKNKKPFFTLEERIDIAREVLGHYPNVSVEGFSGLLKDFVRKHQARVIVRGLRAVSDFEYEFQLASANAQLAKNKGGTQDRTGTYSMLGDDSSTVPTQQITTEVEFQNRSIETIFLPAMDNNHYVSSSIVKEIARLKGDVSSFVSPYVKAKLDGLVFNKS